MKIVLLFLGTWFIYGEALGQSCGDNRQFIVPFGVNAPSQYAESIGTTFNELRKLNPALSDKNFRAGAPICVPIKTDEYWAKLEREKATWGKQTLNLQRELKEKKDELDYLKIQIGLYIIGWHGYLATMVVLGVLLATYVSKYSKIKNRGKNFPKSLLREPNALNRAAERIRYLRLRKAANNK
jgi:hypothetical protein